MYHWYTVYLMSHGSFKRNHWQLKEQSSKLTKGGGEGSVTTKKNSMILSALESVMK